MRKLPRPPFLLVNVTIVVLLVYLILAVEQLRNAKCTGILSSLAMKHQAVVNVTTAEGRSLGGQPIPTGSQRQAPVQPTSTQDLTTPAPTTARHRPPHPACVQTGERAQTFAMVFSGHSGSTAIISELRSHPQVAVKKFEPVDHQPVFDTAEALKIARDTFDEGIAEGKVPGFKIRPHHINAEPAKWLALFKEYNTRIIWQYRLNLFKATVGEYTNRYLNDSSVVEGFSKNVSEEERCKIGVGCRFRVDNMDFLSDMLKSGVRSQKQITSAVHHVSGGDGCFREITYEDYLYEREAVMTDLQEFLGLRWEKTAPERFKVTKDSLCTVVENWDELCKNFYGCYEWQHQLDDARNKCFCPLVESPSKYCS